MYYLLVLPFERCTNRYRHIPKFLKQRNDFYHLVNNAKLTLHLTRLDTINHIVSGQFEGVLDHYTDASKTMAITDGRFDTRLTYSK